MNHRKMKRDYQDTTTANGECSSSLFSIPNNNNGKAKMSCWEEDPAGAVDGDLALLGFNVRASDMADVAQKLEQLDMVMDSAQDESYTAQLSDAVHYNPSDMFGWVQSMLSEINHPNDIFNPRNDIVANFDDASEYDLRAIPGIAAYPPPQQNSPKRLKTTPAESTPVQTTTPASRGVVLVDTQEAGVRLVHTLMACAEAVQQNDTSLADALVKRVGLLAASQPGAMSKVATHFAEALARRIYAIYPQNDSFSDQTTSNMLDDHFYETGPYFKFAHFTANQAILEAFATSPRVHVIDFGLKQGMQWPVLMQALALRPGGPPKFRLTGIGPPQNDDTDALQQVGWKLAQLAETIGVEFEFRGFVASSPADIEPKMLDLRQGETVAVNSVFELHRLLARDGAFERVMRSIRAMRPRIVTVVEQEASHNGDVFLDRFTEALHYYSTMFDSLEIAPPSENLMMSEVYLGKQICNVVACEGPDRVERHERLDRWRERFGSGGFEPVHIGSNAFKQASMLLALFGGGDGYRVEENDGCLMLGWHNRPLIATSAWRVAESSK